MYNFEELDETTRNYMLKEFDAEQSSRNPYVGVLLTPMGKKAFISAMRDAIQNGDEETLSRAISSSSYWLPSETRHRRNKLILVNVDPSKAAMRLAYTEFNTWYVRGLARKLLDEGIQYCQVYRASPASQPNAECLKHENQKYPVVDVYNGHRAKYWPVKNPEAFSIPLGPYCHHTIRRVT